MFQKAVKYQAKLRMAINGPAGAGKTYTALRIATALAEKEGKRVAFVDTEHGSASKYAANFDFDVVNLDPPFDPQRITDAIKEAQKMGYGVFVIDSLSHFWMGTGGLLDIVDNLSKQSVSKNKFTEGWKGATPMQNRMIDTIIRCDMHVIACMRTKTDWEIQENERGRKVPVKVGLAPIQRDGLDYEFDVVLDMVPPSNDGFVSKTRCPELQGRAFNKPGEDVAEILYAWLNDGYVRQMTIEEKKEEVRRRFKDKMDELGLPNKLESLAQVDEPWANDLAAAITGQNWSAAYEINF